jgi:hypothetical protein
MKVNNTFNPKSKSKADKEAGTILIDDNTILTGIPKETLEYKLVNPQKSNGYLTNKKKKHPKTQPFVKNSILICLYNSDFVYL